MTVYSRGIGKYRAGEQHLVITRRLHLTDQTSRAVIQAHGGGGDAYSMLGATFVGTAIAIAEAGFPFISCDFGNPAQATGTTSGPMNFGHDDAITSMGSAITWIQAANTAGRLIDGPGAKTDKFFLYGGSMGSLVALNYLISLAAPASVCAGVLLTIPVLDIDDAYQNDKGGYRSEIGDAYGVTHPTAIPNLATHSPTAYSGGDKAKLTMPIKIWASSDDPIAATTSVATTWAGTIGGNVTVTDLGAVGHSGATIADADIAAFFTANNS